MNTPVLKLVDKENRVYQFALPDGRLVDVGRRRVQYNHVNVARSFVSARVALVWAWVVLNETTEQVTHAEGFRTRADAVASAIAWAKTNPPDRILPETD